MLSYSIIISCDNDDCCATTASGGTVKLPSSSAVPFISEYCDPFRGWVLKACEPTLCPACAVQAKAIAEAAAASAAEETPA